MSPSFINTIKQSLSIRLLLIFCLFAIVGTVVVSEFIGYSFKRDFEVNIRPHFRQHLHKIERQIAIPPDLERIKEVSDQALVDVYIFSPDINWSSNGEKLDRTELRLREPRQRRNKVVQGGFYKKHFAVRVQKQGYDFYFVTQAKVGHIPLKTVLLGILGLLLVIIPLYLLIRWLFLPVKNIQDGVKKIGSGDLSHRLDIKRQDELGELAKNINNMADDIEQMLEAKRQLLLGISHELRSPITRAKVSLSLMEDQSQVENLSHDLQEMEDLIHELLEAERLKGKHSALNLSQVDIETLLTSTIAMHFADQAIELSVAEDLGEIQLDEARVRFVLKNLLDNALKHSTHAEKPVEIHLFRKNGHLNIQVKDYGDGIDKEHLPHLAEAFYRADPSRQRKTGGYGLGLYLVKLIAEAHKGEFRISSERGKGTSVLVTLA